MLVRRDFYHTARPVREIEMHCKVNLRPIFSERERTHYQNFKCCIVLIVDPDLQREVKLILMNMIHDHNYVLLKRGFEVEM